MRREPAAALLTALRWRWVLAVEVALALALGVALYAESLPTRYQATSVVAFTPSESVGADELRLLLPRYPVLLASVGTYQQVSAQTGVSVDALRSGVRITTPSDTANVQITVTSTGPRSAAAAANALAAIAEAASEDDPLLSGEVVAPAVADASAAGPSRRLIEAAGALVALLAGVLAAVLAEQARPRLWSAADVRRVDSAPVVGRLPWHASACLSPSEALAERAIGMRVRSMKATLDRPDLPDERARVLLLTSASRGQGVSTVAALLAVSSSQLPQRTLLIDGDSDAPAVAARTGVAARADLTEALRDGVALRRVTIPLTSTLAVLPTVADDEVGELLARRLPGLIDEGRSAFSTVLVDGSPVLEGEASATLAPCVDGALLVVKHGSPASATGAALEQLRALGVPVLGLVLNGFPERRVDGAPRSSRQARPVLHLRGRADRAATV